MTTNDKNKARSQTSRRHSIEISIWQENAGEKGPWFSVTHRRSYKVGEDWKESDSYGSDDLLHLAKLLDMAHTWILAQQHQQRQQQAA